MKDNFSCIIVDDEPKMVGLLEKCLLTLYDNIEVTGTYNSWNTALQALRSQEYDILFLDISMPGKTGIDLLSLLPGITAEVIFVTAYAEFALNAFHFAPTGYILKPIDDKELSVAVDKAMERATLKRLSRLNSQQPSGAKLGIPSATGIDYVHIEDILYLEATNKCTIVVTREAPITSSYSLARFKTIVEKHAYFQVHRSFIVNLNHVKRYGTNGSLIMSNGNEVPLAKSLRDDFLDKFERVSKTD